ncbi:hypothetical protein U1Q18_020312, partial [Sarracenia purpurea var. burkii]
QLMQAKAQLAQNLIESRNVENQWGVENNSLFSPYPIYMNSSISPDQNCSLERMDHHLNNHIHIDGLMGLKQEREISRDEVCFQSCTKKRPSQTDLGELQALALRMMRN